MNNNCQDIFIYFIQCCIGTIAMMLFSYGLFAFYSLVTNTYPKKLFSLYMFLATYSMAIVYMISCFTGIIYCRKAYNYCFPEPPLPQLHGISIQNNPHELPIEIELSKN